MNLLDSAIIYLKLVNLLNKLFILSEKDGKDIAGDFYRSTSKRPRQNLVIGKKADGYE